MADSKKGQEWLRENPWMQGYMDKMSANLMARMWDKIDLSNNLPLTLTRQANIQKVAAETVEKAVSDGMIPPTISYEGVTFDHGEVLIMLKLADSPA